jgi:F-type H+-transporting ATPase subunit b
MPDMNHRFLKSSATIHSLALPFLLSGGAGGAGGADGAGWGDLLTPAVAKTINLAIFIGAGYLLLRKPTREFFAARLAGVRQVLERAAKEKDAATRKMAELEARINRLGEEVGSIRERTALEAEAERRRIEAETESDIARIRQIAQREIGLATQEAISDLREYAARQSVEIAEQIISREIKPDDDARLIQRVGDELTRVN